MLSGRPHPVGQDWGFVGEEGPVAYNELRASSAEKESAGAWGVAVAGLIKRSSVISRISKPIGFLFTIFSFFIWFFYLSILYSE
jgi:hypothetical protein